MFDGLFVVLVVAALVPLALGFFPQIPLPGPVLEIVLGTADRLGFEAILGAFLAGAVLRLADEPAADKHPQFHVKLSGLGYGFLISVFFVNSGVTFDLRALTSHPATLAWVPVFLAALLLVRGLPAALVYARLAGRRAAAGAGLLQSTSLPLIVAGTQVGLRLDQIRPARAAALVAAGLLSVVLFPEPGLRLLAADPPGSAPADSGQAKCWAERCRTDQC
jgi:Kef-type K+ transport system membrane component KefB